MGTIDMFQMTAEDLTRISNQVKGIVVNTLVSEGFLSDKTGIDFLQTYAIVFTKKGILGKLWDEFHCAGCEPSNLVPNVVKAVKVRQTYYTEKSTKETK